MKVASGSMPVMNSNRVFAIFALAFAAVALTAQTPAPDTGALADLNFTTAQKRTIYQSIAKTQKVPQG
jgi:hypothetical protein